MDIVPEASPLTKMKTNDEIEMEGLMGGFTEVNLDAILSQDNLINALEPTSTMEMEPEQIDDKLPNDGYVTVNGSETIYDEEPIVDLQQPPPPEDQDIQMQEIPSKDGYKNCDICKHEYKEGPEYDRHVFKCEKYFQLVVPNAADPNLYECKFCNGSDIFRRTGLLYKHIDKFHSENVKQTLQEKENIVQDPFEEQTAQVTSTAVVPKEEKDKDIKNMLGKYYVSGSKSWKKLCRICNTERQKAKIEEHVHDCLKYYQFVQKDSKSEKEKYCCTLCAQYFYIIGYLYDHLKKDHIIEITNFFKKIRQNENSSNNITEDNKSASISTNARADSPSDIIRPAIKTENIEKPKITADNLEKPKISSENIKKENTTKTPEDVVKKNALKRAPEPEDKKIGTTTTSAPVKSENKEIDLSKIENLAKYFAPGSSESKTRCKICNTERSSQRNYSHIKFCIKYFQFVKKEPTNPALFTCKFCPNFSNEKIGNVFFHIASSHATNIDQQKNIDLTEKTEAKRQRLSYPVITLDDSENKNSKNQPPPIKVLENKSGNKHQEDEINLTEKYSEPGSQPRTRRCKICNTERTFQQNAVHVKYCVKYYKFIKNDQAKGGLICQFCEVFKVSGDNKISPIGQLYFHFSSKHSQEIEQRSDPIQAKMALVQADDLIRALADPWDNDLTEKYSETGVQPRTKRCKICNTERSYHQNAEHIKWCVKFYRFIKNDPKKFKNNEEDIIKVCQFCKDFTTTTGASKVIAIAQLYSHFLSNHSVQINEILAKIVQDSAVQAQEPIKNSENNLQNVDNKKADIDFEKYSTEGSQPWKRRCLICKTERHFQTNVAHIRYCFKFYQYLPKEMPNSMFCQFCKNFTISKISKISPIGQLYNHFASVHPKETQGFEKSKPKLDNNTTNLNKNQGSPRFPNQCQLCQKVFKNANGLRGHTRFCQIKYKKNINQNVTSLENANNQVRPCTILLERYKIPPGIETITLPKSNISKNIEFKFSDNEKIALEKSAQLTKVPRRRSSVPSEKVPNEDNEFSAEESDDDEEWNTSMDIENVTENKRSSKRKKSSNNKQEGPILGSALTLIDSLVDKNSPQDDYNIPNGIEMIKLDKNSKVSIPIKPYIVENISGKEVELVEKPKENTKRTRDNSVVIDRQVLPNGIEMIKVPGEKSVRIDMMKAKVLDEKTVAEIADQHQQQPKNKSKEFGILHNGIEKQTSKRNNLVSTIPAKKIQAQMPKTFSKISEKNDSKNEELSTDTEQPLTFSQKINDIKSMLKISNKFGDVVKNQLSKVNPTPTPMADYLLNRKSNSFGNVVKSVVVPSTISMTKSKTNFAAKMKPNQNKNNSVENRECYFCTMCYENSTFKSTNPGNVRKHIASTHSFSLKMQHKEKFEIRCFIMDENIKDLDNSRSSEIESEEFYICTLCDEEERDAFKSDSAYNVRKHIKDDHTYPMEMQKKYKSPIRCAMGIAPSPKPILSAKNEK